jgi:hypothetical protein
MGGEAVLACWSSCGDRLSRLSLYRPCSRTLRVDGQKREVATREWCLVRPSRIVGLEGSPVSHVAAYCKGLDVRPHKRKERIVKV